MDRMEFRAQIRVRLESLPKQAVVTFAARAALRVLPLLAASDGSAKVGLRPGLRVDSGRPITAVFAACNIALLVGNGEPGLRAAAGAAANAASDTRYAAAAATTAWAYAVSAYAPLSAVDTVNDAYAHAAAAAAEAAYADSDTYKQYVINSLNNDIEILLAKRISLTEFIDLPLWPSGMPERLSRYWQTLKLAARELDPGFAFWLDWYQGRLDRRSVDWNLMRQAALLPESIRSQSVPEIHAYLLQLRDQANLNPLQRLKPLNRVRAIFIGYGEAGKTSLIRVLCGQEVCPQEAQTAGIDIHEWPVPDTAIQAHFWDFGGQVMVHATHQLFLREACLYVLVISARSEINATEQAEYWLEHVKSFGGNSPVLIVGNRADQADLNINMGFLQQKYSNIVRYFPLSCTGAKTSHQSHYAAFYAEFCQQLCELGLYQVMFTAPQFGVLQALRKNPASFLSKSEFESLCHTYRISDDGIQNRNWLLDVLDKLGAIIHFPTLPFIDGYVLNPRWLTYGVYTLMYAKQAHLNHKEIVTLLCSKPVQDAAGNHFSYSHAQCRLIMDAMREFKLCYSLPEQPDTLIIPALLKADQPPTASYKAGALAFELVFASFLPRHVMSELIVQRHHEIYQQQVWQTGVVLHASSASKVTAKALLQVDYHLRMLQIWVTGPDAREYLVILRDEIQKILNRLNIDYAEYVALPASARLTEPNPSRPIDLNHQVQERAPYRQLLAHAVRGSNDYFAASGDVYSVEKVLNTFISSDTRRHEITQHFTQHIYGPVDKNITHQHATQTATQETNMGNNNVHISNSTTGNVNVGDVINSHNTNTAMSPEQITELVQALVAAAAALQQTALPAQQAQVTDLVDDARALSTEIERTTPRKERLGISLKGIREAAQAVGDIGKPILEIAQQVGSAFGL